ncbi:MAG: hypothetical protein OXC06_00390 [Acidimicrobiaceae bacterium]|nr:hypothetical protein [Acidimicrobiaceae bacterium]
MGGDVQGPAAAHDLGPAIGEPRSWPQRLEEIAGPIFVMAGLGLVAIRWLGSDEGLPNAELAALAVGLPYSALGVLAFLGGRRGRPALMATSSATLGLMCMVTAVTILLLPVAILLFARGVIGLGAGRQRYLGWEELCLSTVLPAAVLLAFGYLLLHEDPASWRPDEYTFHSTSDIVTVTESVLSLGAVTLALGVSLVWTGGARTRKRSSVTD